MQRTTDLLRAFRSATRSSFAGFGIRSWFVVGTRSRTEQASTKGIASSRFGDSRRYETWRANGAIPAGEKGNTVTRVRALRRSSETSDVLQRNFPVATFAGRKLQLAAATSASSDSISPAGGEAAVAKSTPHSAALPVGYADDYFREPHLLPRGDPTKRAFTYMMLGSAKLVAASAVRVLILKFIYTMSASADVLALGTVEVNLAAIPLGQTATIKWRGKPVMIRHRTPDEIEAARRDDNASLRDPEADSSRVIDPEWLVVIGVCTHLGCVPIAHAGDWGGFFCPCHGSHYDVSGRVRKGPAPLNLEVPKYAFTEDGKLIIG